MLGPTEPQTYDEKEYSEGKESSLHRSYSSQVKSGDDFLPPPDGHTVNFKHDLHRGLKSRQIAMVCFLSRYDVPNAIRLPSEEQLGQVSLLGPAVTSGLE